MRTDVELLADIVELADTLSGFLVNVPDEDNFLTSDLYQSAMLFKLELIGEAAARLSPALKEQHPEIRWKAIIATRNIIIHDYAGLDLHSTWTTLLQDVPILREQVAAILAVLPADDQPPSDDAL